MDSFIFFETTCLDGWKAFAVLRDQLGFIARTGDLTTGFRGVPPTRGGTGVSAAADGVGGGVWVLGLRVLNVVMCNGAFMCVKNPQFLGRPRPMQKINNM